MYISFLLVIISEWIVHFLLLFICSSHHVLMIWFFLSNRFRSTQLWVLISVAWILVQDLWGIVLERKTLVEGLFNFTELDIRRFMIHIQRYVLISASILVRTLRKRYLLSLLSNRAWVLHPVQRDSLGIHIILCLEVLLSLERELVCDSDLWILLALHLLKRVDTSHQLNQIPWILWLVVEDLSVRDLDPGSLIRLRHNPFRIFLGLASRGSFIGCSLISVRINDLPCLLLFVLQSWRVLVLGQRLRKPYRANRRHFVFHSWWRSDQHIHLLSRYLWLKRR